MNTELIESAVARWNDPERRPLFKGQLVDADGCMCAQGDVLHHELGWSIEKLRKTRQHEADEAVATALAISVSHAILLRHVNDRADGQPQGVLKDPASILGPNAAAILVIWLHFDRMSVEDWTKARDAWAARAARDARAAWAARDAWAAWAARDAWAAWAARDAWAAWDIAFCAVTECGGVKWLPEHDLGEYVFLPMFGFANPEAVLVADAEVA